MAAERASCRASTPPLSGYVATNLTITVPCAARRRMAESEKHGKTVLLSTWPKQAPKAVDLGLLIDECQQRSARHVRNTTGVSAPLSQCPQQECQLTDVHRERRQGGPANSSGYTWLRPRFRNPGKPRAAQRSGL